MSRYDVCIPSVKREELLATGKTAIRYDFTSVGLKGEHFDIEIENASGKSYVMSSNPWKVRMALSEGDVRQMTPIHIDERPHGDVFNISYEKEEAIK